MSAVLVLLPLVDSHHGLSTPTTLARYDAAWHDPAWHDPARYDRARATVLFGSGTLTTPNSSSNAITYDADLAPIGAAVTATIIPTSEGSTAEFTVLGLVPNREYTVSAYTKACGATTNSAGTRFQYHHLDPDATSRTTSSQAPLATSDGEISLAFRTDAAGIGTSRTTVAFTLTDQVPGSMVMQDETRRASPSGQAVKVSTRIACLTLSKR